MARGPHAATRTARSAWPGIAAWTVATGAAATGLVALVVVASEGGETSWKAAILPALWGVPGALLASARPRNAVGWLVLAVAAIFSGSALAEALARLVGPGHGWSLWYVDRFAALIVPCTLLALLLLPDGRLPSRRWRVPVAVVIGAQLLLVLAWMFVSGPAAAPDSDWPAAAEGVPNPVGFLPAAWAGSIASAEWLLQLPLLLVLAAVAVRIASSRGEERTRVMSLLLAMGVFVVTVVVGRAVWPPVADVLDVLAAGCLAGVLVSAVLRRRLDGVAVAVSHSFAYAVLVLLVAGGYAAVVGLLSIAGTQVSPFGAGVVAALAALAVFPLRARLQRLVDRLMYGDRADPYSALTRLAAQAHAAPTEAEVLACRRRLRGRLAPPSVGPRRRPSARAPSTGATRAERSSACPSSRERPTVGTIEVRTPALADAWSATEVALLAELGRHAGVTVNAVRLAQEAASHQRRLLAVREEERRRVGRELHDELGPTVAGLSMQLGLLRDLVRSDPQLVAGRLDALHASALQALEDIRRVAHDLRPPVLDQLGLEGGLRQVAESLGLPASMDARTPAAAGGGGARGVPHRRRGPDQRRPARRRPARSACTFAWRRAGST